METEGFYKEENGEWFYGPNFIKAPTYELYKENKDEYVYPNNGWTWYNEAPQAYIDYILSQEI